MEDDAEAIDRRQYGQNWVLWDGGDRYSAAAADSRVAVWSTVAKGENAGRIPKRDIPTTV